MTETGEGVQSVVAGAVAESLCQIAQTLAQRGWLPATSGNLSVTLGERGGPFAITRSGADKQRLQASDLVVAGERGRLLISAVPGQRPSAEANVHAGLYQRLACGAILHVHTVSNNLCSDLYFSAGAMTVTDHELLKALGHWEPQAVLNIPIVENWHDLEQLAEAVVLAAQPDVPGVLVRNHGIYVWGEDADTALKHLEAFEFLFSYHVMRRLLMVQGAGV